MIQPVQQPVCLYGEPSPSLYPCCPRASQVPASSATVEFMKQTFLILIFALAATASGFAQAEQTVQSNNSQEQNAVAPGTQNGKSEDAGTDRIGAGDLLDISVMDVPELTAQFRVTDRGNVNFPLLGTVEMGGLTVQQAQERLISSLREKDVVKRPVVSVLVAEYSSQVISVLGEVGKPSSFPLIGNRKLYDALSAAGGLLPTASNQVTLLRQGEPERVIPIAMNVNAGSLTSSNIDLLPGDTIVVRRAGIVYVMGQVGKPGGFVMQGDHISVLQALALAEGAKSDAKLNHAMIIHRDGALLQQRAVKLDLIIRAQAPDVLLGPEDVLFLPQSIGKASTAGIAEGALRMATAAMIYVAH